MAACCAANAAAAAAAAASKAAAAEAPPPAQAYIDPRCRFYGERPRAPFRDAFLRKPPKPTTQRPKKSPSSFVHPCVTPLRQVVSAPAVAPEVRRICDHEMVAIRCLLEAVDARSR